MKNELEQVSYHIDQLQHYKKIEHSEKRNKFVMGYYLYIKALLTVNRAPVDKSLPLFYIVGDSHCLSYAHTELELDSTYYQIVAKVVVGCKAWHLATDTNNDYKVNLNSALKDIPAGAKVAFVFGEIDCRSDEGIIPAHNKKGGDLHGTIDTLVVNYLKTICSASIKHNIEPCLINVPAPVPNANHSASDLLVLKDVVYYFNQQLGKNWCDLSSAWETSKLFDVYSFTNDEDGLSSGKYHIDGVHLSPTVLSQL